MFKIFKASFNVPKLNGAISLCQCYSKTVAVALKPKKQKSTRTKVRFYLFVLLREHRVFKYELNNFK